MSKCTPPVFLFKPISQCSIYLQFAQASGVAALAVCLPRRWCARRLHSVSMQMPSSQAATCSWPPLLVTGNCPRLEAWWREAALGVFVLWLTFFITPFHYLRSFFCPSKDMRAQAQAGQ